MQPLIGFFVFWLGAAVGSFVNVLVSRSVKGENWVNGRSKCDHCEQLLAWYDMIPIVSYLFYQGKSRCCHKKLSWSHPVVEGLFGLLFLWWLLVGFIFFRLAIAPWSVVQPILGLGMGCLVLILAVADAMYGYVLMPVVGVAVFWIYGYRSALYLSGVYDLADLGRSMLGGALSFGFLWLLHVATKGRGMGDGDAYLAFVTGSLLAGIAAFWGLLTAFIIGAIWGITLLLLGKKKWGSTLPFGPFIILGAIVTQLFIRF